MKIQKNLPPKKRYKPPVDNPTEQIYGALDIRPFNIPPEKREPIKEIECPVQMIFEHVTQGNLDDIPLMPSKSNSYIPPPVDRSLLLQNEESKTTCDMPSEMVSCTPNTGVPCSTKKKTARTKTFKRTARAESDEKKNRMTGKKRDEKLAQKHGLEGILDKIKTSPQMDEVNDLLSGYSDEAQKVAKDIRRRSKNKEAAKNCRKKKQEKVEGLQLKLKLARKQLLELKQQRANTMREQKLWEEKVAEEFQLAGDKLWCEPCMKIIHTKDDLFACVLARHIKKGSIRAIRY